jgi:hypothetical protein
MYVKKDGSEGFSGLVRRDPMRRAFPALMLAWCCTLSATRELAPSTSKATVSSMSGCIGRPCDPVDEVRSRPPCVGVKASSWSICVRMRSASVHGVCMCVNAWSGRGRVQGLRVRYLVANARLRARDRVLQLFVARSQRGGSMCELCAETEWISRCAMCAGVYVCVSARVCSVQCAGTRACVCV